MRLLRTILFATLLLLITADFGIAQSAVDSAITYKATEQSTLKITGTSTIHDWEADVKEFEVTMDLSPKATNTQPPKSEHYRDVTVQAPVKKIESGKGGMNSKIYDALKEKKHPEITFSLNDVTNVSSTTEDTTFTMAVKGDLTIAGVTRTITIEDVNGRPSPNGSFQFTGSKSMKMSSFKVDPPSAMFGAIKAGDNITVSFDLTMAPMNPETASK